MGCAYDMSELRGMLEASGEREALRGVMLRLGEVFQSGEEAQAAMEVMFPDRLGLEVFPVLDGMTDHEIRSRWQESQCEKSRLPMLIKRVKRLAPKAPNDFRYEKFERFRRLLEDDALQTVARQFCHKEAELNEVTVAAKFNELWSELLTEADRWSASDASTKALAAILSNEHFELAEISLSFSTASWHTRKPKDSLASCLQCGQMDSLTPLCLECTQDSRVDLTSFFTTNKRREMSDHQDDAFGFPLDHSPLDSKTNLTQAAMRHRRRRKKKKVSLLQGAS